MEKMFIKKISIKYLETGKVHLRVKQNERKTKIVRIS